MTAEFAVVNDGIDAVLLLKTGLEIRPHLECDGLRVLLDLTLVWAVLNDFPSK